MSGAAWTALAVVSGAGAAALGWLVYGHKDGLRGLTAGESAYQSPDGQLRYTPDEVLEGFERLGEAGRARLKRCWWLGVVFLMFLGMALVTVTHNVVRLNLIKGMMYGLCVLFTSLAIGEKALLHKACADFPEKRRTGLLRAAAAVGTGKWAMAALWVAILFAQLFVTALKM